MFGIPMTFDDIATQIAAFFAIDATNPILALVIALGLVTLIASAIRSLVSER